MYVDNKIKTKKYKENIALLNYLQIFKIIPVNLMLLKFKKFLTYQVPQGSFIIHHSPNKRDTFTY